jgi:hypothetical protein
MMVNFSSSEVNVLIKGIDSVPFSILENNKKIIIYRVMKPFLKSKMHNLMPNLLIYLFLVCLSKAIMETKN